MHTFGSTERSLPRDYVCTAEFINSFSLRRGFHFREILEGKEFPIPVSDALIAELEEWQEDLSPISEEQVRSQLGLPPAKDIVSRVFFLASAGDLTRQLVLTTCSNFLLRSTMMIMMKKFMIGKIKERETGGPLASLHPILLGTVANLLDGTQVPLCPLILKLGIFLGLMTDRGAQSI